MNPKTADELETIHSSVDRNIEAWKEIMLRYDPEFVWLRFMPLNGSYLVVMVPTSRFYQMLKDGLRASVSAIISHGMKNDHIAKGAPESGVLYLEPDLSSTYINPGDGPNRVEIMTSFVNVIGSVASACARSKVASLSSRLRKEYGFSILLGFEVEVIFMRPVDTSGSRAPLGHHSWCSLSCEDASLLQMIEEIVRNLYVVDAAVEKFHAETAPGQWEFVLSPRTPVEAVDMLLRARETIRVIANKHGLRATLHPRPYPDHAGTGAHTRKSVRSEHEYHYYRICSKVSCIMVQESYPTALMQKLDISASPLEISTDLGKVESFFAGILWHLPSIAAFAMPLDISYKRVRAGIWSVGEYVCWGWENRETPLRRITDTRFEFKLMCGTANPYVTICAILAAGIDGLTSRLPLFGGDCQGLATNLTLAERTRLQITTKLPITIEESLNRLTLDDHLARELGEPLISAYVSITREWNGVLRDMEIKERENWIINNY